MKYFRFILLTLIVFTFVLLAPKSVKAYYCPGAYTSDGQNFSIASGNTVNYNSNWETWDCGNSLDIEGRLTINGALTIIANTITVNGEINADSWTNRSCGSAGTCVGASGFSGGAGGSECDNENNSPADAAVAYYGGGQGAKSWGYSGGHYVGSGGGGGAGFGGQGGNAGIGSYTGLDSADCTGQALPGSGSGNGGSGGFGECNYWQGTSYGVFHTGTGGAGGGSNQGCGGSITTQWASCWDNHGSDCWLGNYPWLFWKQTLSGGGSNCGPTGPFSGLNGGSPQGNWLGGEGYSNAISCGTNCGSDTNVLGGSGAGIDGAGGGGSGHDSCGWWQWQSRGGPGCPLELGSGGGMIKLMPRSNAYIYGYIHARGLSNGGGGSIDIIPASMTSDPSTWYNPKVGVNFSGSTRIDTSSSGNTPGGGGAIRILDGSGNHDISKNSYNGSSCAGIGDQVTAGGNTPGTVWCNAGSVAPCTPASQPGATSISTSSPTPQSFVTFYWSPSTGTSPINYTVTLYDSDNNTNYYCYSAPDTANCTFSNLITGAHYPYWFVTAYNCGATASPQSPNGPGFVDPTPTPNPWMKVSNGDVHSNQ